MDTTAVAAGPDNALIAERLETLAALLDLAGASSYSVRAYRRAAELIRATPAPVAELVRQGRVRELRGVGPSIEARLQELVETGGLAEIDELEAEVQPELVGLGRLVGLGPQRMVDLGRTLGIRTADELREAAAAGRLRDVPGIGAATEAKIAARLAEERPAPRHGLVLSRAHALADGIAGALGGTAAGDPRRWRELSDRLAVVVPTSAPAEVLDRFAALPEIVAVLEREPERALGVTVDGVPVEAVAVPPDRFGTELVRATGSEAYVASLGALPTAATRGRALRRRSVVRFCRPSCVKLPSTARHPRSSSRLRFAATCTCTPRGRTARRLCSRWPKRRARSATTTSRSATTRRTSASCPGSTPTICAARRTRSRRRTNGSRRSASCAAASATSSPTARSTCPTTSSTSSSGCRHRCTRDSGSRASSSRSARSRPSSIRRSSRSAIRRAASSTIVHRTPSTSRPSSRRAPRTERRSRRTGYRTGSISARSSCATRSAQACASRARRTRTRCAGSRTCGSRSQPRDAAGRRRPTC